MKLHRTLGFGAAYATSVGLVVSGTAMVALGNGFGTAGAAFAVPVFFALLIIAMISLSYSELVSVIPGGGMIGEYTLPALGRLVAMVAVLGGYLVLVATDGGTQLLVAGKSLEVLTGSPGQVFSWLLLALLIAVNVSGVKLFARLQIALAFGIMGLLAIMGLIGLLGLGTGTVVDSPVVATDWGSIMKTGAVAVWLFIGMEFVCPLAEELRKPWRQVPLGMLLGVTSIFLVDVLFGWGLTRYVPLDQLAQSATPHILGGEAMVGTAGLVLMTSVTIFASFSTGNAELSAVPRMLYGLANSGLLPKVFAKLHPVSRVPVFGVLFTGGLMALTLTYATFSGTDITLILRLISVACVTWLISYIIAQVNVIVLRRTHPHVERRFRTPFYPLPQVIGILGCLYLIAFITPETEERIVIWTIAGILLGVITLFSAIWLRYQKLPLFKRVPLEDIVAHIEERSERMDEYTEASAKRDPSDFIIDGRDDDPELIGTDRD